MCDHPARADGRRQIERVDEALGRCCPERVVEVARIAVAVGGVDGVGQVVAVPDLGQLVRGRGRRARIQVVVTDLDVSEAAIGQELRELPGGVVHPEIE